MSLKDVVRTQNFRNAMDDWWHSLRDDRGQRAALRRCKTVEDVYISLAFHNGFVARLQDVFTLDEKVLEGLALPVGVLSHAQSLERDIHFARLFAQRGKGSPDMRDVRFRRLMSVPDRQRNDLYVMLIRLVRLMDDAAGLDGLLQLSLNWNDSSRMEWARAYYPNRSNQAPQGV